MLKLITRLGFNPNNPPYTINNKNNHSPLDQGTISMDAKHNLTIEYNMHNLYGMLEASATQQALQKVRGKRALGIILFNRNVIYGNYSDLS